MKMTFAFFAFLLLPFASVAKTDRRTVAKKQHARISKITLTGGSVD